MSFTTFFKDAEKHTNFAMRLKTIIESPEDLVIWDAGCGAGHATYSLAIIISEIYGLDIFNRKVSLIATDIDEIRTFRRAIKTAVYYRNELVRLSDELIEKYFIGDDGGDKFTLVPAILEKVRFVRHDILSYLPPHNKIDAIVCLNVLHHFTPQEQIRVFDFFKRIVPSNLLV
jgi:two-component system CheB/CheR fusion protein